MMVQSEVLSEPYVFGHVTECDDLSEDGGPLWQAEVQTLGGYGVAATVYAGTEEAARRMAEQAITAWNTRTPAVATDEGVVERVARALEAADKRLCELTPTFPPDVGPDVRDAGEIEETGAVVMQIRAAISAMAHPSTPVGEED